MEKRCGYCGVQHVASPQPREFERADQAPKLTLGSESGREPASESDAVAEDVRGRRRLGFDRGF
jgi:hypothetical protein